MHIEDIRKDFGARLKELRKQKKWTQKELATKIDSQFSQLNKYECGLNIPPADKLILLAEHLDTTVDYLLSGNRSDENTLHNTRLIKRVKEVERFDIDEQDAVIKLLDAMIMKNRMTSVISMDNKE